MPFLDHWINIINCQVFDERFFFFDWAGELEQCGTDEQCWASRIPRCRCHVLPRCIFSIRHDETQQWFRKRLALTCPDLNVVCICLYHLYLSVSQCQIQSFKCWWLQVLHLFALLSVGRSWLRLPDFFQPLCQASWEADILWQARWTVGFLRVFGFSEGNPVRNCSAKIQQFGWGRVYDVPNLDGRPAMSRIEYRFIASWLHRFHSWCVRIGAAPFAQQTWHTTSMQRRCNVDVVSWCYSHGFPAPVMAFFLLLVQVCRSTCECRQRRFPKPKGTSLYHTVSKRSKRCVLK